MDIKELREPYKFKEFAAVKEGTVVDHNGTEMEMVCFDRGDSVAVALFHPLNKEIILVKQYRFPAHLIGDDPYPLELVAGKIDKTDVDIKDAILREIREETGYEITGTLELITSMYPSIGASNEVIHIFYGELDDVDEDKRFGGCEEENEHIEIVCFDINDAYDMVLSGYIIDSKAIIAIQHLILEYL